MRKEIIPFAVLLILCIISLALLINTNEKTKIGVEICDEYSKTEHVTITYPDKRVVFNNKTYSLEILKQSCSSNS